MKLGRCFEFLNNWYGFKHGSTFFQSNQYLEVSEKLFHSPNDNNPSTQKELAESYGITQQTMSNYMRMASMIPELEDLVDTGILAPITAIDDDLQDENSKLRALISNNFGRRKNDPAKDRKALETYVELKGYKSGEHGDKLCQNGTAKSSLDEIAKELNMSKRNLQRALRIERNLTNSMKELLDTGEITKTFASDTIASLSEKHIIFPYHPIKTKHKFEKTC